MKSLYLEKIKAITSSGLLTLAGNRMLIEIVTEAERTTKSGIITDVVLHKRHAHEMGDRARVAVVLAVGPGYTTEEGEHVDLPYKAGDYILINQYGAKTFADFFGIADYKSDSIGMITDDLVSAKLGDFEKFQSILRG